MDATCKIQDGIHMPRIIKKCVQDSGYISFCLQAFCQIGLFIDGKLNYRSYHLNNYINELLNDHEK